MTNGRDQVSDQQVVQISTWAQDNIYRKQLGTSIFGWSVLL